MISDKLKEWKYYLDKFPLYFKNDENIIGHFRMLYDLIVHLDNLAEQAFQFLDIFNTSLSNLNKNVLDMIGAVFGVSRNISFDFTLTIVDGEVVKSNSPSNITLSDLEFLTLIQAQIIKNNYNGTYEDINTYYNFIKESTGLKIFIKNSNVIPGKATVFLMEEPVSNNLNYYYLLYGGLMTVESAGVEYDYEVTDTIGYLYWNVSNWNEGRWA